MMTYTIETWFPKIIYYQDNFSLDLISKLENTIKKENNVKRTDTLYVDSTHKTNNTLHKKETYDDLSNRIQEEIKNFLAEYGYSKEYCESVYINNMWYNVSNQGDFNFPHNHAGSIVSGVFYVKANNGNKIRFYNDLNKTITVPDTLNQYSYDTVDYDCVTGRLILFFSDFVHGNPRQDFEGEKIAISFNTLSKPL